MQTEPRPWKGFFMRKHCRYPFFLSLSLSFFFLSFSLSLCIFFSGSAVVHVLGCFWFLIYSILWEGTIFGTLEMFTPGGVVVRVCVCVWGVGGTQQPKYLEYFILNPHAARHLTSPPQSWERGNQYWYIKRAFGPDLLTAPLRMPWGGFYRPSLVDFDWAVCRSYQRTLVWSNRWAVSWYNSRKTSCATGSLAPFLFLSGL